MKELTAILSNAMQAVFLVVMIGIALIRLTDGRREQLSERIALFLVGCGAFFQLVKAAHPSGTAYEVLITNFGVVLWMGSQMWAFYEKKINEL